jgi:transcriptional antiterminator RfaH
LHDLRQIQRLIASGLPIGRESCLPPGTQVRVRVGPLAGLEGVVTKHRGRHQLLVAVTFLQQGASVAIQAFMVEPR